MAAYFTQDFNEFFIELASNNNKEWFDQNRKRYHQHIKDPFYSFVGDLIKELTLLDPRLDVQVGQSVFRINNDIRFAKHKPLYKTHVSAAIQLGGRKNNDAPGFYVQLGPGECLVAVGCYKPSKDKLHRIRLKVQERLFDFNGLWENRDFVRVYGGLGVSEMNKVLPKSIKESGALSDVLYNKQFYASVTYDDGQAFLLQENLLQNIVNHRIAADSFMRFLEV